MTALTDKGFTRDDLAMILATMQADILRIYPDATLDASTQDGQLVGVFSNAIDQVGQVMEAVYDSGSPSTAYGVTLTRIVEYNGIQIINGTQTRATLKFGGDVGRTIPANTQVKCSANDQIFYTVLLATIGVDGTATVDALAQEIGAIPAPAGTLTILTMPIYGVRTVTNPTDALIGKDRETDPQLRLRRSYSTATPSQTILEGIKGAVANIPEVIQVEAYENKTDLTDQNGLPPHSFCIVVQGGDDNDIAQAIWLREPVGSNQYGNTTVVVYDANGQSHPITFRRPTLVPIFIRIELHPLTGWTESMIDQIKESVVEWTQANWRISSPVVQSQLYIPVNAVSGTAFSIKNILTGRTLAGVGDFEMLPMAFGELAQTTSVNISVVKI